MIMFEKSKNVYLWYLNDFISCYLFKGFFFLLYSFYVNRRIYEVVLEKKMLRVYLYKVRNIFFVNNKFR